MGTEIELLVDAEGAGRGARCRRGRVPPARGAALALPRDSELSRLNRDGSIDACPDLLRVVELALAARERTGGRFDPTVHDAVVAAGYDRSFELVAADGRPPARTRVPRRRRACASTGDRIELDAGRPPRSRRDRQGLRGRARRRAARQPPGRVSSTPAATSPTRGGSLAGRRRDGRGTLTLELAGGALATSGRDRRRWRRGGRELHHLIDPRTGRAGRDRPAPRDGRRGGRGRGRGAGEVALPRRRGRRSRRGRRRGIPAVLVGEDGRTLLAGGLAMKRPDLLDPRARERAHRVRAADGDVLAGLVLKSRPFGRAVKAAAVDRRAPVPHAPRARRARAPRRRARARPTVHMPLAALLVPGLSTYRPLPVALGVVAAELAVLIVALVPAPPADRRAQLAAPALGDVRRLRPRDRRTASRPAPTRPGRGRSTSTSGRSGAVAFATAWRALGRPIARPPSPLAKGAPDVPDRDRPLALQRLRRLRRARTRTIFELDGEGIASLRVGASDDAAALDAAAACPMGAITVDRGARRHDPRPS